MKLESICPLTTNSSSELFMFRGLSEEEIGKLFLEDFTNNWRDYSPPEEIIFLNNSKELLRYIHDNHGYCVFKKFLVGIGLNNDLLDKLCPDYWVSTDVFKEYLDTDVKYPITLIRIDNWANIADSLREKCHWSDL